MKITTRFEDNYQHNPKDDFYKYVNKEWLEKNPIPDSESRWGTFDTVIERTSKQLRKICEDALKNNSAKKGSNTQIIKDFYASAMNMERRNNEGLSPIKDLLTEIDAIKTDDDLVTMIAKLHTFSIYPYFDSGVDKDEKDPDMAALYVGQNGLTLPDRDYYLEDSADMQKIREQYLKYMIKLLKLSGLKNKEAKNTAQKIYDVELYLAKISKPREEVRQRDKNYHKYTVEKAVKEFAVFRNGYLTKLGANHLKDLIIQQPEFIKEVGDLLTADIETIKLYLKWKVLTDSAGFLSKQFVDAKFNFFGKVIQGLKKQRPLWKRVVQVMQGRYGTPITEALGPVYIEKYFSSDAKTMLYEMIENIRASFKKRVENLDWMDEETKKLVYKKVDKITFKLGYPDKWEDISKMEIKDTSFILNYFAMQQYKSTKQIKEAGKPANWDEWIMKPTIVNACADQMREMTFPAAFFQDVFFDPKADMATNYGSAGSIMGHELSHFVDDQGSKYDADGKLNEWWPKKVREAYEKGAKAFVDHYNKFSVDGVPVNGKYTQGENIGDVAGLMIAYDALQKYMEETGDRKVINGLTPEQRFFIGYARTECGHMRLEARKERYKTDPHAPGEVRVNGALSIIPEFVKAFNIKKGDGMYVPPTSFPKLW